MLMPLLLLMPRPVSLGGALCAGPRSKYSRREEREKPREDGEVAQQDRMQCSIVERLTESDKRPSTSPAAMAGLPFGRRFRPRRLAREPASQPVRRVCKEGLKIRKEAVIVGWAPRRARAHTPSTDQQQQRAWLKVRALVSLWRAAVPPALHCIAA